MDILALIQEFWALISLIAVGVGGAARWLWKYKSDRDRDKSTSKRDKKKDTVDGDAALFQAINEMKVNIVELQKQSIEQGQVIAALREQINNYKLALRKLTLLCDVMCDSKEKCRAKIQEVLADLNLEIIEDEERIS